MTLSLFQREIRKWTRVAHIIAATARSRFRFARGNITSVSGSTHTGKDVSESLLYIRRVFDDYLRFASLRPEDIEEKVILELGPGDNLGVALLFLAQGASRVVCLDKFRSVSDPERERRIYLALREQLTPEQRARFDDAIQLAPTVKLNSNRIEGVYGSGAQDADTVLGGRQFDIIVSRAVLEEVTDTERAFLAMDRLLRPGGLSLHKIDLSDYGTFASAGMHPLEFLTIPPWIYRWMADDNGRPNRRSIVYYRDKVKSFGYEGEVFITEVLDRGAGYRKLEGRRTRLTSGGDYGEEDLKQIGQIRPRLAAPFRDLADEDLLAAGIFLVARKAVRALETPS